MSEPKVVHEWEDEGGAVRRLVRDSDGRLRHERLLAGGWRGLAERCQPCKTELARLAAENRRLWEANESAAVCRDHLGEFTGSGCLVCERNHLRDVASRRADKIDRLRGALGDFRDHGTRHDLNPTMNLADLEAAVRWCHEWFRSMDQSVRDRARAALRGEGVKDGE